MIEQASVMYAAGASSHCRESEWCGVFPKGSPDKKGRFRMMIASDSVGFPKKISMGKRVLCRDLSKSGTLENTGNVVFLLANNVPCRKEYWNLTLHYYYDPKEIHRWIQQEQFEQDEEGYFKSLKRILRQ